MDKLKGIHPLSPSHPKLAPKYKEISLYQTIPIKYNYNYYLFLIKDEMDHEYMVGKNDFEYKE